MGSACLDQGVRQVSVNQMVLRIQFQRLFELRNRFLESARASQCCAEVVADSRIVWVCGSQRNPFRNGGCVVALFAEIGRVIELPVNIHCGRVDLDHPVSRNVDELGQVHRSVGGRGVIDEDSRAIVAVLVDVREVHLGVGPAALR